MQAALQRNLFVVPTTSRATATRLAYIGRQPIQAPRDSDAWFTPPEYIDSVRTVMGRIDLDPFSSEQANHIVQADYYFTAQNSAFDNDWRVVPNCKVFMNPPYSAGLCARAANRFVEQFERRNFAQGIVLVNNATDTRWFKTLVERASAICFTDHRISFWNIDGKQVSGNTRGQAFLYFGRSVKVFTKTFEKHGMTLVPTK